MKKKMLVFLIIALLSTDLYGCANEKATVTTTVYAVKYLVEQLAGDKVNVEYISSDNFIQRATIVDNYDDILQKTTVFLYIDGLEPYLSLYPEILQNYDMELINLANLSAIYNFKRYKLIEVGDESVLREEEYYSSDLFEHVDEYDKDPFIWLDPIAMSSMAVTIKDWLCSYYPEDTLTFENRFKELQQIFVRMDAEFQSLNDISNIKFVTVTASFGNWQKLYGVEVYPLILSKYGALPTEEQLAFIESQIRENDVKYIAYDDTIVEQDMLDLYERVKTDLGLEEIDLSSLSRLSQDDIEKNKDYITIMYENLTALEKAFK
ncbi:MAG: zinc ABC transporter substrate-binding protein [Erysipelotrichia bacterium]|nr:zinc ABC transporter substrate-binding protein [Erysipelotrichia bacterium]